MGKHTPGPWFPVLNTADCWDVNVSDDRYAHTVASVYKPIVRNGKRLFDGDEKANANLIAAAPDLLAFVEEIVTAGGRYSYLNETLIIADAYKLLRKARGEDNG